VAFIVPLFVNIENGVISREKVPLLFVLLKYTLNLMASIPMIHVFFTAFPLAFLRGNR